MSTQPTALSAAPAGGLAVAETVVNWLRPGGAGDIAAETKAWGPGEWGEARRATLVHGVAPLLAQRLEGTAGWLALAPELREYCAGQRALNRQRLSLMIADLAAILRAAADIGVAVLPLKGIVLATQFYREPGLRPMADIDLLVRAEQAERMGAALGRVGLGLVEETPRHRAYLRDGSAVVAWDGEHPDNPRGVEVHSSVGERLRAIRYDITAAMWSGTTPGSYAGALGLTPAPDALLQHLLIHTCHNMVNRRLRLIQLYDIALVAPQVAPAAWRAMAERAISAGEARLLYAPLALAEATFGPLAPGEIRDQLAPATPPALRRLLARATPSELSLCARGEASPAFRLAWYRPGREQLGALLRVALPATAELRQCYPSRTGGLARAYLRHIQHTLGWAVRAAAGRSRRMPGG